MLHHIKCVPEKAIHAIRLELIADFGGAAGVRDEGLLTMSLERPRNKHAYGERDIFELAAAFAVMDVFLRLNGCALAASEEEACAAMIQLAAGDLQEAQLARWLAEHTKPL